jgi:hypothetical protein
MGQREEFPAYALTGLLLHEFLKTLAAFDLGEIEQPDGIWSFVTPYARICGPRPFVSNGLKDARLVSGQEEV